jgi:hypothetical protein
MFAGHIGIALGMGRLERRINLGALVFASLLLDVALWVFVLLHWESVEIPANFATTHQPEYRFPYSHSLIAAIGWSGLAGVIGYRGFRSLEGGRFRGAMLMAFAVFSHWPLDVLVHTPELPLAGEGSPMVGLCLWNAMPVALATEAIITVAGLCLYLSGSRLSRTRKFWLTALTLFVLVFTILGMTVAPPPPSVAAMALSSAATIGVVILLVAWIGKESTVKRI